MAWSTSQRKTELPANWQSLRAQAKARAGGVCERRDTTGTRCTAQGRELHHTGDKHDHRLENLQWICPPHHQEETNRQAKAAQHTKYVAAKKRTPEPHPGIRGKAAKDAKVTKRLHLT